MAKITEVRLVSHIDEVLQAEESAVDTALEAVGLQAVGDAQLELENDPARVDTGLLRNSIAYALAGEQPSVGAYRGGNTKSHTYQNDGKDKNGNPVPIVKGKYSAKMPKTSGEHAVYVGTNVEYAPYVHEGFNTPGGGHVAPNRFLKNAVEKNINTYKEIFERTLSGEL